MKTFAIIGLAWLAGSISASAQSSEKTFQVIVENPWQTEKADEPVVIDLHTLKTDFTVKSAVVSDGSAVLGLGNIGALAAMPVMEGKAVLFKEFGGSGPAERGDLLPLRRQPAAAKLEGHRRTV